MESKKTTLMNYLFRLEYKNYLLLETTIFKLYEVYINEGNNELNEILKQNINVAKNTVNIMLEMLQNTNNNEQIKEILNNKIIAVESIERYLIMMNQKKKSMLN